MEWLFVSCCYLHCLNRSPRNSYSLFVRCYCLYLHQNLQSSDPLYFCALVVSLTVLLSGGHPTRSIHQTYSGHLGIESVVRQYITQPVTPHPLQSHLAILTDKTLWCSHQLNGFPVLDFVTVSRPSVYSCMVEMQNTYFFSSCPST